MTDNELIAQFMGVNYYTNEPLMKTFYDDNGDGVLFHCEWHPEYSPTSNVMAWVFAPNKNWCQLMPVVEKIERLGYTVYIFDNHCKIWEAGADPNKEPIAHGWSGNVSDSQKIPGTFEAVVEFIKWYNSNHPQP